MGFSNKIEHWVLNTGLKEKPDSSIQSAVSFHPLLRPCIAGILLFLLVNCISLEREVFALEFDFRGQISGWTTEARVDDEWQNQSGLRSIPELTLEYPISEMSFVDLEASLNGFAVYRSQDDETDAEAELYRLKLRYATPQTETQIGLQRINFGPAQLLRSLQWFDQLDKRDPLQLTDGVYALRFRYTALNNANLWLWGLYGNDEPKGYELLPSVKETPEFGGRLQYPLFDGEFAVTAHTREVDASQLRSVDFRENRCALDGRWEVKIGFWFEAVLQHQDLDELPYQWGKSATLGVDYTFGIGNGLYTVVEHRSTALSEDAFGWDEDVQVTAVSLSYPVGLFDNLMAIGYYAWEQEEYSQHLSWQRTYDNLVINASLFRYPDTSGTEQGNHNIARAGYGGQVMLVYYH